MLVERIMNKLKSLSIAQMVLPQRSLYRRRIPLFLSDIPVAVSNCRLYCHLIFALNLLSIHSLCFIKGLARPMSLYKPCRQEWLGRGTCLVNSIWLACGMTLSSKISCHLQSMPAKDVPYGKHLPGHGFRWHVLSAGASFQMSLRSMENTDWSIAAVVGGHNG